MKAHARFPHCGTFDHTPEGFEIFYTLRQKSAPIDSGDLHPDYPAIAHDLGVPLDSLFRVEQVHGATVHVADRSTARSMYGLHMLPPGDGIITDQPGVALLGLSADCPILLAADPESGAIGVAHSGWRGVAGNIAGELVDAMQREYGVKPRNLRVFLGPGAGPCCYEVSEEVLDQVGNAVREPIRIEAPGNRRPHLDLNEAIGQQLAHCGVPLSQGGTAGICTICSPENFFSYRRDGAGAGRFAGVIMRTG
jgi:YfiH family protein